MQAERNNIRISGSTDGYITISGCDFANSLRSSHKSDDAVDALRYSITTELYKSTPQIMISTMITRVIFNNPATIVFWNDGTKTVVKKSEDDVWDPEKGLCMAIIKKINGKTNFIRKVVEENLEPEHFMSVEEAVACLSNFGNNLKGGE